MHTHHNSCRAWQAFPCESLSRSEARGAISCGGGGGVGGPAAGEWLRAVDAADLRQLLQRAPPRRPSSGPHLSSGWSLGAVGTAVGDGGGDDSLEVVAKVCAQDVVGEGVSEGGGGGTRGVIGQVVYL